MKPAHAGLLLGPLLLAGCGPASTDATLGGYVEAELVYVAATSPGVLAEVAVKRGDTVRRGQRLFLQDNDAETLTRDAAQARRERADFQAANLRKARRPEELRAVDQQLAQAQAALAGSEAALKRQQSLVEQGFVAAQRLDELLAARDRDAARVRELQAQAALARQAAREDEIAAASAEARGSAADLALARWREGQRQRVAPADALVFDVMNRPGEWVNAGAPVVALLPAGALKLRFFVPETALPRARVGSTVAVACDGCPAGLQARIRWVSPQAEFTPPVIYGASNRAKLVYAVDAEPTAGTALKPGQPVDVRLLEAAAS